MEPLRNTPVTTKPYTLIDMVELRGRDSSPLNTEIARCVAGKLQHLSTQVLADSCHVHGRCGADTTMAGNAVLQVPVDTAYRELVK